MNALCKLNVDNTLQDQEAQAARLQAEAASHAARTSAMQQMTHDLQSALADETAAKSAALIQVDPKSCFCLCQNCCPFVAILHKLEKGYTLILDLKRTDYLQLQVP